MRSTDRPDYRDETTDGVDSDASPMPANHPTGGDEPTDEEKDAFVEETSRDSFPASDAPAW